MGIANDNTYGSKKTDFNWQLRMLQMLQLVVDAINALPQQDYELRITPYKANANGTGYSTGDFITRTDIVDVPTGSIVSTLWFNETTGLAISAPPIADLDPYIPPSSVTVSNLPATLGQMLMAQSMSVTLASDQSTIAVSEANGANVALGSTTDVAVSTDANGTVNAHIRGLIVLLTGLSAKFSVLGQNTMANSQPVVIASNQSAIATSTADGGSVTVGTINDATVAAGGAGTLSAKLRRVTQGLEDLKSLIVLAAGTNVIGKVGIDQTTSGTSNAVYPLATENHIGSVTGIISTVSGSITRPNDTNTYAPGDEISNATSGATIMSIANCARVNNGSGRILSAQMVDSANQNLKLDGDLFLFDTTVTMQGDNVAFAPTDTELATCVGIVSFTGASCKVGNATSGAGGNVIYPNSVSGVLPFTCIGGGTTLYGKFVARNAFIPVASEVFTFRLVIDQY